MQLIVAILNFNINSNFNLVMNIKIETIKPHKRDNISSYRDWAISTYLK